MKTQSEPATSRFDFRLSIWKEKFSDVDAVEPRRNGHVIATADWMSVADWLALEESFHARFNLHYALAKLCPSAHTTMSGLSELRSNCPIQL